MASLRSAVATAVTLSLAAVTSWVAWSEGLGEITAARLGSSLWQLCETVGAALVNGHARAPAVVVGIAALAVVPALALAMLTARTTVRTVRRLRRTPAGAGPDGASLVSSPTALAWIEVAGRPDDTIRLSGEMVRIGRDAENDVVLDGHGLECFHAVIRRTEARWMVVDVSGGGIEINGERRAAAPLADGDRIGMGEAAVVFHRALSVDRPSAAPASWLTH